jgi:SCP-2 sterol transfer family
VAKGEAPAGKKADVILSMSDEDFGKMVSGKTKAQNLFMSGKLKVKGNVMKGELGSEESREGLLLMRVNSDEDGAHIGESCASQGEAVNYWKETPRPLQLPSFIAPPAPSCHAHFSR